MNVKVTSVDQAPDELYGQTPFAARVLRQIPGPDRPDYLLAELARPLTWLRDGTPVLVRHLVLCARWVGGVVSPGSTHLPINIAYVVDSSVLTDAKLDFAKCHYSAIGTADVAAEPTPPSERSTPPNTALQRTAGGALLLFVSSFLPPSLSLGPLGAPTHIHD